MSLRIFAAAALAAALCLAPSSANAGIFGHRAAGCGCDAVPSCGCEIAMPSCGCEIAPTCDPCCNSRGPGLLARLKAKCAARKACCAPAPTCCEPAPVCCEPAPVCCEPAPVCCDVDPCCKKPGIFARLKAKFAARKSCCEPTCGCEMAAPSCGCEVASCGCGM